jgi:hypothetical protein
MRTHASRCADWAPGPKPTKTWAVQSALQRSASRIDLCTTGYLRQMLGIIHDLRGISFAAVNDNGQTLLSGPMCLRRATRVPHGLWVVCDCQRAIACASGGLDNSSQPRIRLFLVEFLFALRAVHTSFLYFFFPNFRFFIN